MNIAELTIKNSVTAWVVVVVLFIGGILSFNNLAKLEDPNFAIKEALVITNYPGASALQVASEVSEKLEIAIGQMSQVRFTESTNAFGLSIIKVTIKKHYDAQALPQVWDELRRKVGDTQSSLPVGAYPSLVNDAFGDVYGILLAITADGYSYAELEKFADMLKYELSLVKNVAKIEIWGEQKEAIHVEISRADMAKLGIGMDSVISALNIQNRVLPAGAIEVDRDFIKINPTGTTLSMDDIANLNIIDPSLGRVLKLKDIATLTRGYIEPAEEILRHNSKEALSLGISIVEGGSVIDLGKNIERRISELEPRIPIGFEIDYINNQPKDVERAIGGFLLNFLEAVAIVFVVLLVFMGIRSGLLVGSVMVLTVLGTFMFMRFYGVDLQRISLGAMVIALGMLVDNAIVVTEGILIRLRAGDSKLQAAKKVVSQNMMPLLGATIISILAFASVGASQNEAGEFTRSLFYVILISLLLSWVTALSLIPLFAHRFLKISDRKKSDNPYSGFIFVTYRYTLEFCLRFRWLTLFLMAIMLFSALYLFIQLKGSFFPPSTRAQFLIHYHLPEGSDIRATSQDLKKLETHLLQDERVTSVASFIGNPAPRFMLTFNPNMTPTKSYGMIIVKTKEYAVIDGLVAELEKHLAVNFPDAQPKIKKIVIGPPDNAKIEVRFSGSNPAVLRELSKKSKEIFRATPLSTSIKDDWRHKVKEIRPQFSKIDALNVGISRDDFHQALKIATTGKTIGVFREDDKLIPIILRYKESERVGAQNLNNLQIFSPITRESIPIKQVTSEIKTQWSDALIRKRDGKYTITVSCEPINGVLASEVLSKVKDKIENIELPIGYKMQWGGEFESSRDAQASLLTTLPLTFLAMAFILVLLFNSVKIPIIIFLTIPLVLIGVATGLFVTNLPFSFMALLGFLSLTGMQIKNSIVLIDQINVDLKSGYNQYDAIVHASISRLRPVAMAAITTVLGMIPLATDAFFNGMAVTIMAGLSFATVLTLIVLPVFYAIVFNVKKGLQ
jgi:multidrug efflux pump subunit AcrB